jgi:imidazoleglycerol-phosphate dehydratase
MSRTATVHRVTRESDVLVEVDIDGTGRYEVTTGVGFFDHMLESFAKHSLVDLTVRTQGDVHVDAHHSVEDTALALGAVLREALGDRRGIRRFGDALVPLDETLVQAAVDLSGRPYCVVIEPDGLAPAIGAFHTTLARHVWESLASEARLALHVRVLSGRDAHHVIEAQVKAVARAMRAALERDPRVGDVPSTKGVL